MAKVALRVWERFSRRSLRVHADQKAFQDSHLLGFLLHLGVYLLDKLAGGVGRF
jgi:hypothetical protein